MTDARLKRIHQAAMNHARKYGYDTQECEDFAQEATLLIHENPARRIDLLFIDYLRETFGDNRHTGKRSTAKKSILNMRGSLDTVNEDDLMVNPQFDLDFNRYQNLLTQTDRTIITLLYKWDFTLGEVGECLGVSESRVSQMLTELKKKLPAKLERLAYSKHLTPLICS